MLTLISNQVKPSCGDDNAPSFAAFWRMYPRRVAKKDALRAWDKLTVQQQEEVIAAIEWQAKIMLTNDPTKRYILHPATYLNGQRWEDDWEVFKPQEAHKVERWNPVKSALEWG